MEKRLPIHMIEETPFIVDVEKNEIREVNNPANRIGFDEMQYEGTYYKFQYDQSTKNLPAPFSGTTGLMLVHIPQKAELDPEGMAAKYNVPASEITGKRDFEIIVDQEQYSHRMSGNLPVIEIMGHPFYVDVRMGCIRPHDDFSTAGIEFSKIEDYLHRDEQRYWVPYDPSTHSFKEIDAENILSVPKDHFLVEIPLPVKLDPVGYARLHGFSIEETAMEHPIQAHRVAKVIPWDETSLAETIEDNKKRLVLKTDKKPLPTRKQQHRAKKSRRRKM